MIKDYFVLSFKNLKHRGIRSWLTLLGIFIGITAVVSLISLGTGLQTAVASQFGLSSTEIISVQAGGLSYGVPGSGAVTPLTIGDVEAIEKLSTIKRAVRRNLASGKLEYNDKVVFSIVTNIPYGEDRDFIYEQLEAIAVVGRFLEDKDTNKVVLGHNFYVDKVGLDKIIIPGKIVLIQDKKFEVVGILEKKGSFIFDNVAYMNGKDLEKLMGYGDDVDIIAVQPKSKELMKKAKEDIEKLMRDRRDVKIGEEDFEVSTPQATMDMINDILQGVKAFIFIVAMISVFIGLIGIVNTMTTSVLERKKEIGIMKAIGSRNKDIFMQFFVESSLLGLVGGIVGAFFGSLIGIVGTIFIGNWLGAEMGLNIDPWLIFFSLLGSFFVGGIAGIVPAMNAAKLNPVESLRG